MRGVILAGGLGTRLRSVVPDLPKPMAPVAGRPFLEFLIERLVQGGVTDLVLSVGYRSEAIHDHFGQAWGGARLDYVIETEPLGTGGAVALATEGWPDAPVLVLNGDTYLGLDYRKVTAWGEARPPAPFAMVLQQVNDVARYGAVDCEAGVVRGFTEKGQSGPGLINAGVYILSPAIFSSFGLTGRFSLEADLLQPHLQKLRPKAYIADAFFIDIGVPDDYLRAQIELPRQAASL